MKKGLKKAFAIAAVAGAGIIGLGTGIGAIEFQREIQAPPGVHCTAPKGDGHPVLVVPALTTDDKYMQPLADRIRAEGYKVYGWEVGYNLGPDATKAAKLEAQLKKIYAENGNQKVSLVGYSLGGVYAREVARAHPEMVRDVITLSSPINWQDDRLEQIHKFYTATGHAADALPVPTTALYSNHDWIVKGELAKITPSAMAENIEVQPGHGALPFSAEGQGIVLNRLAQTFPWQPMPADACRYTVPKVR